MKIQDVMTKGVECIAPDASIQEAAQKMRDLDIGPLPVCANDRLTGFITDRDIVIYRQTLPPSVFPQRRIGLNIRPWMLKPPSVIVLFGSWRKFPQIIFPVCSLNNHFLDSKS